MKRSLFFIVILVSAIAAGCQVQESVTTSPAIEALEDHLNALVEKDEATLTMLSCADWEANALLELDSFQAVETRLEGLSCRENVADDGSVTVACEGVIVTSYGGEMQEFDLSERTYKMVEQGGDWLVCGY
ncbi:MAG: hypothetical protein WEA61_10835 [Anaerolineales bacterium]